MSQASIRTLRAAALALGCSLLAARLPAQAAPADSPRSSPLYLVLMLEGHGSRQITGENDAGDERRKGLGGIDFSIQSTQRAGVGLAMRTLSGPFDSAELGVLLGTRTLSLDVGAGFRSGWNEATNDFNDTTYTFGRVGFRSRANLGNTDFSVTMRGATYIRIPSAGDEVLPSGLKGFSAETGLAWTVAKWRIPWTLQMGYRIERFTVYGLEEETSSLSFGGGVVFGRR